MRLSDTAANAQAVALAALLEGGRLRIFAGQSLLAACAFGAPAFGPPVAGRIVANPIAKGIAEATGIADRFDCIGPDEALVLSGTAGEPASGADLILTDTNVRKNAEVTITEFAWQVLLNTTTGA